MQQLDADAIETFKIPRLLLMEHAGLALARVVQSLTPPAAKPILVCAGTGFNGGDGLAAARHLHLHGYPLRVVLTAPSSRLSGEPAAFAAILQHLQVPLIDAGASGALASIGDWFAQCALIVDALLGIGIRGAVREPTASLIRLINGSGKPVVSADVPSGLDADAGTVQGVAVRATHTVTFGLPKQGCFLAEGPAHTGSLTVDPITFPPQLLKGTQA